MGVIQAETVPNVGSSALEQRRLFGESAGTAQFKRIHIIINPAAGRDRPMLSVFNSVFQPAQVDWDVSITKAAGDARRLARQAAATEVEAIAVYGGDGTVMEVASALVDTQTPMIILPGGTGNSVANELGIPRDIAQACRIACDGTGILRAVDVGQVTTLPDSSEDRMGDAHAAAETPYFLLHAGIGLQAQVAQQATRAMKDHVGMLAYLLAGLEVLEKRPHSHYQLTLDGREVECDGLTCLIANTANLGAPGLTLSPSISMSDGLLDVIVIHRADLGTGVALLAGIVRGEALHEPVLHVQAQELTVRADPLQEVEVDGEVVSMTPLRIQVLPGAMRILAPAASSQPVARDTPIVS
jgi:diacylglycerol kinase (ATP)